MPVPCDTIADAIRECFSAHSAQHLTVREIAEWIHGQYPDRWATVATSLSDLVVGGSRTGYPPEQRFLRRVARGVYALAAPGGGSQLTSSPRGSLDAGQRRRRGPPVEEQPRHAGGPELFKVSGGSRVVVGHAEGPPPWPPTGPMKSYVDALRRAIGGLVVESGDVLRGTLASSRNRTTDAENALFYNVGPRSFSAATRGGIQMERVFRDAHEIDADAPHRVLLRYELTTPNTMPSYWALKERLAAWERVPLPAMYTAKPAAVWAALCAAEVSVQRLDHGRPRPFGLTLTIRDRDQRRPAATIIKPIVDGVVSAFHFHDNIGALTPVNLGRLAEDCGRSTAWVAGRLHAQERALLGGRELIRQRTVGPQWNPADEYCVWLEVLIDRDADGSPTMSGAIHEVEERPATPLAQR